MTPSPSSARHPPGEPPFFLVGCPRSGTTLLQRLLDAHPDLCVAPETFFVRRFWQHRRRYGELRRDHALEKLLSDLADTPEFAGMGLDPGAFSNAARRGPRTWGSVLVLLLEQYRVRCGARRAGEKTPNHLLFMRELETLAPGCRFVHIVRDARAVVASWRSVPWSTGSVAGDAEVWRRYLATARRRPPREPGAMLTVRYEALAADPEPVLREVCGFLEVAFEPRMLDHAAVETRGVDVEREPWKGRSAEPITPEPIARWRDELDATAVRRIESVAAREMRRWGYAPETAAGPLAPTALRVAAVRAALGIKRALLR